MKKLLLMAAVAGFALASCTSEDETYEAQNNQETEISFAAPITYKAASRAFDGDKGTGEIDGKKYPETGTFIVYGWKYKGLYKGWNETQATENKWSGAFDHNGDADHVKVAAKGKPVIGWFPEHKETFDNDKKYLFAAYSPSQLTGGTIDYGVNGLKITDYTNPILGAQFDIMYSNRVYNADKHSVIEDVVDNGDGTKYSGVNLKFKHAMSSIHFKTCVDPEYIKICNTIEGDYSVKEGDFKIKSIKIIGVSKKGNFTEFAKDGTDYASYSDQPTWIVDRAANESIEEEYKFLEAVALVDVPFPNQDANLKDALIDITDGNNFQGGQSGIMIPQDLAAFKTPNVTSGSKDIFENPEIRPAVEIVWAKKKITEESGLDGQTTEKVTYPETTTTIYLDDFTKNTDTTLNGKWLPGKKYIYNIIFKENLIYFAPEVIDWETNESEILPVE